MRSAEVAFLRARYDEREQAARAAAAVAASPWRWQDTPHGYGLVGDHPVQGAPALAWVVPVEPGVHPMRGPAEHIELHDPAAVLADLAAKRAVLDEHQPGWSGLAMDVRVCMACAPDRDLYPCRTLRLLVQEFSTHSDYDPDWAGPARLAAEWRAEDGS